jgi:hypothetical protein
VALAHKAMDRRHDRGHTLDCRAEVGRLPHIADHHLYAGQVRCPCRVASEDADPLALSDEAAYISAAGLVREIQRRGLQGAGPIPAETRSDAMSASEPDAAVVIREWATLATEVAPRVSPIMLLIRSAAANDHDLVELLEEMDAQRLERMTHNAERLIRHPEVRPDLSGEQIRDILWTYASPDLYQLLVLQRGWTLAGYGDFLFRGMISQLLQPDEAQRRL